MSAAARAWVLHVDLDQFLAAVEVLRRPELTGRPVIVGGRGDPSERAVVSTASYEAREYGIRSGMPLRIAARKAPEDAVFLPVDFAVYERASDEVMTALREIEGAVVEILGWDEAFLGVSTAEPEELARDVQAHVLDRTRLHCSIGVGDNKVRAKMATDFGKPRGVFVLTEDNWFEVMAARPTRALWGVGSKVSKRLAARGITTVTELAAAPVEDLVAEFGPRMGQWYRDLAHGRGPAVVDDTPWVARSHSRETTYQQNLTTPEEVDRAVRALTDQVLDDTAAEGRPVFRVHLKVRYAPFETRTIGKKLPAPTAERADVLDAVLALTRRLAPDREVRLLGVRAEMTMPDDGDTAERTPVRGRI